MNSSGRIRASLGLFRASFGSNVSVQTSPGSIRTSEPLPPKGEAYLGSAFTVHWQTQQSVESSRESTEQIIKMHEILKICNVILQLNLLAVPFSGKVQSSQSSQRSSKNGIFFELLIRETLFQKESFGNWNFELLSRRNNQSTWQRYRSAICSNPIQTV